jgi:hypothetical protein
MAKKNDAPIRFDLIGGDLAKMLDIKRRLIEAGIERGDPQYARRILDDLRNFVGFVREELEAQFREGNVEDMTPEKAQQAIYGCQIFEDSLRADYPESQLIDRADTVLPRASFRRQLQEIPLGVTPFRLRRCYRPPRTGHGQVCCAKKAGRGALTPRPRPVPHRYFWVH